MNHKIIKDVGQLDNFIKWLPELKIYEKFLICLQARKKYMPSLQSTDKTQLKRVTATKENLKSKLMQLECPIGTYRTKANEIITDEAIAVYITPNPRCEKKATFKLLKQLADNISDDRYDNPHSEAMTAIHRSKGTSYFAHFDIDFKDGENIEVVYSVLLGLFQKEVFTLIKTRGGAHILVDVKKAPKTKWHPEIVAKLSCDQVGDLMMPIPGCNQGGFIPYVFG